MSELLGNLDPVRDSGIVRRWHEPVNIVPRTYIPGTCSQLWANLGGRFAVQ